MPFVEDTYVVVGQGKGSIADAIPENKDFSSPGKTVKLDPVKGTYQLNHLNPFARQDYSVIIRAFERECAEWSESDYALAYHYRDTYGLRQFSYRVAEQMNYYPGMHQSENPPSEDPALTNARRMEEQGWTTGIGQWKILMLS